MTDYTSFHDFPYFDALNYILEFGEVKSNRTGIDTKGVFGLRLNWDLQDGFPLLTSKRIAWKSMLWELLWFMKGDTNIKWLNDRGVTIWDEWADGNGDLGPVYGFQWRSWPWYDCDCDLGDEKWEYIDQLQQVVDTLKTNPDDRRMIVSAWNVGEIREMRLPPCHLLFQFYVREGKYLDCQMYQRSCDMFLGVPFNIASYSALIHIIAHLTGLEPGRFYWVGGDCHIYVNHIDQVEEQLSRTPRPSPQFRVKPGAPDSLNSPWHINDFELTGYDPHPGIKAEVAV